jgi:Phage tail tube protein
VTIRDDGLIEGADPTIAALTGRIDVRFNDTTLIDLAGDGTPVDLEFAYTLSALSKLVLIAHEVYLPKPKLAVEGRGGVQASGGGSTTATTASSSRPSSRGRPRQLARGRRPRPLSPPGYARPNRTAFCSRLAR